VLCCRHRKGVMVVVVVVCVCVCVGGGGMRAGCIVCNLRMLDVVTHMRTNCVQASGNLEKAQLGLSHSYSRAKVCACVYHLLSLDLLVPTCGPVTHPPLLPPPPV
jgi:hypothetical protein